LSGLQTEGYEDAIGPARGTLIFFQTPAAARVLGETLQTFIQRCAQALARSGSRLFLAYTRPFYQADNAQLACNRSIDFLRAHSGE
jgi:hypothetical protein